MVLPIIWWFILGIGITVVTTTIVYWPKIISWLSGEVSKKVYDLFGKEVEEAFNAIINYMDTKFTTIRRGVKSLISGTILLIRSVFVKKGSTYTRKDEVYMKGRENEKIIKTTNTEEINYNDIPDFIKEKFTKKIQEDISVDYFNENILKNMNEE